MAPEPAHAHPPSTGRDFPDLRVERGDLGAARWVMSTTLGGVSRGDFAQANLADHVGDEPAAVHANRSGFATALAASRGLAVIQAEHGARVAVVDSPGTVAAVDGLITRTRGLGLMALGADCAVIGLFGTCADGSEVIAVAHCGWRGLVEDIIGSVVAGMADLGVERTRALIGPAICGSCYQVSQERCEVIAQRCSSPVTQAAITRTGGCGLDIAAGVQARLTELGVASSQPFGCTFEDERWFSLRRAVARAGEPAQSAQRARRAQTAQPAQHARTGRHALGMMLP